MSAPTQSGALWSGESMILVMLLDSTDTGVSHCVNTALVELVEGEHIGGQLGYLLPIAAFADIASRGATSVMNNRQR